MSNLSRNIRFFRLEKKWSQETLAEKLDKKSYTTIQKWESGVSEPSIGDTSKMADMFGVTLSDLVEKNFEHRTMISRPDLLFAAPGNMMVEHPDSEELAVQTKRFMVYWEGLDVADRNILESMAKRMAVK